MKDIFEDMQEKIGYLYLSDLPYHKRVVWYEMKRLLLTDYETKQLEDFSRYVFGISWQILQAVIEQKKGREELADCRRGKTESETKVLQDRIKKNNIYGIEVEEKAYG